RTAMLHGRRPRTRMMWFDRSALRVRRWSDRAAPQRGSPTWRSLGDGHSWPVLVLPGPGGPRILLLVYRSAVMRQGFGSRLAWRTTCNILGAYCSASSGFCARTAASVAPPATVMRLSAMRWMPRPNGRAFLAVSVRVLTPIQAISEDRRPYSIFGQRFITTFSSLASARFAALSLRMP